MMRRLSLALSAIALLAMISYGAVAVGSAAGWPSLESATLADADTRGLDAVVLEVGVPGRAPGRILVRLGETGFYSSGIRADRSLGIAIEGIGERGRSVQMGLFEAGDPRAAETPGRRLRGLELTTESPDASPAVAAEHLGVEGVQIRLLDVRLASR